MIEVTSHAKETQRTLRARIVRIEPLIIKRENGIICPDIVLYHPGRKNQEGYKRKKQAVTYGLKKTVVLLQTISRMNERNKKR